MRRYESVVILHPDMLDDDIHSFTERFSTLIRSNGGEIIKIEDWGFKRLAYLVNKKERGRYILFDFVGLPALITEMERQFKITEEVMKFLSVKLEEDVDLEAFKSSAQEKAAAPVDAETATPAPMPVAEGESPEATPQETEEPPVIESVTQATPAADESTPAAETEEPGPAESAIQPPAPESRKEEE
jgi:small subunit ribosomal protein S6